jgi:AcrR family transcriptional regulator
VNRLDTERVPEILEAACRVIGRDSAHGLRMEAVAREAGVSKALVHYYFATRRELIRGAFLYSEDRSNTRCKAELARLATGAERLERLLVLDLDDEPVFRENRTLWGAAWSVMRHDEELRPEVERLYRAWIAWIAALVEEGREDGSIQPDVDAAGLVQRLSAVVDGLESQLLLGLVTSASAAAIVRDCLELELGARAHVANRRHQRNVVLRAGGR